MPLRGKDGGWKDLEMVENAGAASREVFALTDEQIVGLEPEGVVSERGIPRSADSARNDGAGRKTGHYKPGMTA